MAYIYDNKKEEKFLYTKYPTLPVPIRIGQYDYNFSFVNSLDYGSVEPVKQNDDFYYKIPYHTMYKNNHYNISYTGSYTDAGGALNNGYFQPLNLSSYFKYLNENEGWKTLFSTEQQNRNWNKYVNTDTYVNSWPLGGAGYATTATPIYNNLEYTSEFRGLFQPIVIPNPPTTTTVGVGFSTDNVACNLRVYSPSEFKLGFKMIVSGSNLSDYFKYAKNRLPLYKQFFMVGIKGGLRSTEANTNKNSTRFKFYGLGDINSLDLKLNMKELRTNVWCLWDNNFCTFHSSDRTQGQSPYDYISIAQPILYFANGDWSSPNSTTKGYVVSAHKQGIASIYSGPTGTYDSTKWESTFGPGSTSTNFVWALSSKGTYFVNEADANNIVNQMPAGQPIYNGSAIKLSNVYLAYQGPGYSRYPEQHKILDLVYTLYPPS